LYFGTGVYGYTIDKESCPVSLCVFRAPLQLSIHKCVAVLKIHSSEERKRLQKIIETIKPFNLGVMVRTAAEGMRHLWSCMFIKFETTWKGYKKTLKGLYLPKKIFFK
jgi:hypothetical protein